LLKRMTDKGFVGYKQRGKVREYYPMVKKPAYFSNKINAMIRDFFNDSNAQFASFFTNETDLSLEELEELMITVIAYVGFPTAVEGFRALREIEARQ